MCDPFSVNCICSCIILFVLFPQHVSLFRERVGHPSDQRLQAIWTREEGSKGVEGHQHGCTLSLNVSVLCYA